MTTTVSVKIPSRLLERMPKAGQGRSGFIVQALEEKLARQTPGTMGLRTFLGSGVLLAAWRGEALALPAVEIMSDDTREFVTSQLVRLELLPKPRFQRRSVEVRFYESPFAEAVASEPCPRSWDVRRKRWQRATASLGRMRCTWLPPSGKAPRNSTPRSGRAGPCSG